MILFILLLSFLLVPFFFLNLILNISEITFWAIGLESCFPHSLSNYLSWISNWLLNSTSMCHSHMWHICATSEHHYILAHTHLPPTVPYVVVVSVWQGRTLRQTVPKATEITWSRARFHPPVLVPESCIYAQLFIAHHDDLVRIWGGRLLSFGTVRNLFLFLSLSQPLIYLFFFFWWKICPQKDFFVGELLFLESF